MVTEAAQDTPIQNRCAALPATPSVHRMYFRPVGRRVSRGHPGPPLKKYGQIFQTRVLAESLAEACSATPQKVDPRHRRLAASCRSRDNAACEPTA